MKARWVNVTYKDGTETKTIEGLFVGAMSHNCVPSISVNWNNLSLLKILTVSGETIELDGEILSNAQIILSDKRLPNDNDNHPSQSDKKDKEALQEEASNKKV
jgi:hypothetical protein